MGRLAGYEYSYSFRADDSVIPLYSFQICTSRSLQLFPASGEEGKKIYLFDIRTSFKLKGDEITDLGWERFCCAVPNSEDDPESVRFFMVEHIKHRLQVDYGMSDDELRSWALAAFNFAKQTELADDSGSKRVVAVVVEFDVWTVQQEGEPIDAAKERAIKTESLIPIYAWSNVPQGRGIMSNNMQQGEKNFYSTRYSGLLMELLRIRVKDEALMALTCAVCSRNSAKGTQLSPLPSFPPTCKHVVHPRCLFEWLRDLNSCCPLCSAPIPTDQQIREDLLLQLESTPPTSITD